ncbi:hypothetical protein HS7_07610 [Sulfolobales archaeon HS-7]|nr:hypothetical protein HS7_07610 [Sulfolobales archaeon HS-7]
MFFVPPRARPFEAVLYSSTFYVKKSLLNITIKYGLIARYLSMFRVSTLYIIDDVNDVRLLTTLKNIHDYLFTPPYARKNIRKKRSLTYVGLIDPIDIPPSVKEKEWIEGDIRLNVKGNIGIGDIRDQGTKWVIITDSGKNKTQVYKGPVFYSGYRLKFVAEKDILNLDRLVIGSRNGNDTLTRAEDLRKLYRKKGITIVVGPPKGGITETFFGRGIMLNFVKEQGVYNVRSEEALFCALSIVNAIVDE